MQGIANLGDDDTANDNVEALSSMDGMCLYSNRCTFNESKKTKYALTYMGLLNSSESNYRIAGF